LGLGEIEEESLYSDESIDSDEEYQQQVNEIKTVIKSSIASNIKESCIKHNAKKIQDGLRVSLDIKFKMQM